MPLEASLLKFVEAPTPSFLVNTRDVFQILFFVVVGAITVLTYLKAKRTLLQPLRTELFKEQLKLLTEISTLLSNASLKELHQQLGISSIVSANSQELLDDYGEIVLGVKPNPENQIYESDKFLHAAMFMNHDVSFPFFTPISPYNEDVLRLPSWEQYRVSRIHLTKEFIDFQNKIEHWINSPIIPIKVASLLAQLTEAISVYPVVLKEALEECATTLASVYPDKASFEGAQVSWVASRCNKHVNKQSDILEEKASQVVLEIRLYYDPDNLFSNSVKSKRVAAMRRSKPNTRDGDKNTAALYFIGYRLDEPN